MTEKHPNELELLSFVEEELGADARLDVVEHLVACRACTEQVRRLETGRAALRSAPPLELSDERRAAIFTSLPERRDPWRLFRPLKRGLVIAAPVAAAAALAVVFVVGGTQLGSSGDDDDAGEAAVAEDSAREESGGADQLEMTTEAATDAAPLAAPPPGTTLALTVQGPPAAIVRLLADEGIEAEVEPNGGVIAEARAVEVRDALAGRAAGNVPVYVR